MKCLLYLGLVYFCFHPLSESKVLKPFHAFTLSAIWTFMMVAMTMPMNMFLCTSYVGVWMDMLRGSGRIRSWMWMLFEIQRVALAFFWRFEIDIVFDRTLFPLTFINFRKLLFSIWDVLGFRKSPGFISALELRVGSKKIMNSHRWNLHLFLINRRSYLN